MRRWITTGLKTTGSGASALTTPDLHGIAAISGYVVGAMNGSQALVLVAKDAGAIGSLSAAPGVGVQGDEDQNADGSYSVSGALQVTLAGKALALGQPGPWNARGYQLGGP